MYYYAVATFETYGYNLLSSLYLMLKLETVVATGKNRIVYQHPSDAGRIVKIETPHSIKKNWRHWLRNYLLYSVVSLTENRRELLVYKKLADRLDGYIPQYDEELVETDKGIGLVSTVLCNSKGQPLPTLWNYAGKNPEKIDTLKSLVSDFLTFLRQEKLYFYDFNPNNFVVDSSGVLLKLWLIDIKGYRNDLAFLPLTYFSDKLASKKMQRRGHKLLAKLDSLVA